MRMNRENRSDNNIVLKRNINEETINHFKTLLNNTDWSTVIQNISPNESYEIFLNILLNKMMRSFLREKLKENKKSCKPMNNQGINQIF